MQTPAQESSQGDEGLARKVDEFSVVASCDHGAYLDNFAMAVQNEPQSTGYIICYGPAGEGNGSGKFRCQLTVDYMVQVRGLSPDRFKTVYGGHYKDPKVSAVEFWIVPPAAEPPAPQKYEKTLQPFTGKFHERYSYDNYGIYDEDGPSVGDVTLASFAELLQEQPDTIAYIVGYGTQSSTVGAWRRAAREIADSLESDYKISADRIKVLCGGYDTKAFTDEGEEMDVPAKVEWWILPKDSPPPVKEVTAPEPKPAKAVMLTQAYDVSLDDEPYARRVFQGFADLLREDARMRACIIIHPLTESAAREQREMEKQGTISRADLYAVADAWQKQLEKDGVGRDRLIVMTAEPSEQGNLLETWVVPEGAQLPDPNASQEEQGETTDEMTQEERSARPEESLQP